MRPNLDLIGVVEALMSAGRWDEIRYAAVPSRAMTIYRNAFMRHDEDRYAEYIRQAVAGQSAAVFRQVMQCVGMTPVEAMEKIIGSGRYDAITVT